MNIGINNSSEANSYQSVADEEHNALSDEYQSLEKIYEVLIRHGEVTDREKKLHIDWYKRIINHENIYDKTKNNIRTDYNFILLAGKIDALIIGDSNIINEAESAFNVDYNTIMPFYLELEKINTTLTDKNTTEKQAVTVIERYNALISEYQNIRILTPEGKEIWCKAMDIKDHIDNYLISREMITFGYFVDRMDIASKYSYNINVKYYRDGMQKYTKFYEELAKKLSSYGEYMDGTEDDGKKVRIKQHRFYLDLQNILLDYYPANGNLENTKGENCSLYKGQFEIVTGKDKNDCSIYVDGALIDSGISYDNAYNKMSFFLSAYKRPATGTQIIKKIKIDENKETGKPQRITVTADVIAYPGALMRWIEIDLKDEHIRDINSYAEKSFADIALFDKINCSDINKNNEQETLKINEVFNREMNNSYMNQRKGQENAIRVEINSKLNSYNTIIDGIKKELQMTLDEYSQRYNTINSNYDNMLRTITTMINELAQELKGFLRF
ncbi:hypothetical protein AB7X32_07795 [Morganella morganii]|uniref:hypothetical protein n=1 Tax=Morganella morganii TaxID=582 RepID=UPI0034E412C1